MSLKRKHVEFTDAEAGPSSYTSPAPAGDLNGIHPDRLAALQAQDTADEAHVKPRKEKGPPKEKTDAQKRYLKKKTKKLKKVKAAQKAAAPKNNNYIPAEVREDVTIPVASTSVAARSPSTKEKKKKKRKISDEDVEMAKQDQVGAESPKVNTVSTLEDEKKAKRERREKRRAERAQEQIAAAQAEEAARQLRESLQASREAGELEEPTIEPTVSIDEEDLRRTPEIEAMPSFPMPLPAAQPDPALLQRQGLPSALHDAQFVEESRRLPLEDVGSSKIVRGIDDRMRKSLDEVGIREFFAVQASLLPVLLPLPLVPLPSQTPLLPDYLISAPTGSGKTLAYAIPIIHILQQRVVTRLRALIILPTRDLVTQVRETLETLSRGTGLRIGTATGQHSFAHEQTSLVGDHGDVLRGGMSKVDILIATPGRLMDHLNSTPNFTLQHLRFLVIDEADRLLGQSFQNWLPEVLAHTRAPIVATQAEAIVAGDAVADAWLDASGVSSLDWEGSERDSVDSNCQKLLFSATLTRDPSKIASLRLRHPKYFIVQSDAAAGSTAAFGEQFALPAGLKERMIIMSPELKPLMLLHLLHSEQYSLSSSLCFTKSVESATRLVKLIEFFEDAFILGGGSNTGKRVIAKSYSSELKETERRKLLDGLAKGSIDLLVCSDLIARGIDLPSVANVISYDVPLDMRKYVHRVGRTARAGREGKAWSLVEKQEARHFKLMLEGAKHREAVENLKVKEATLSPYTDSYKVSLQRLRDTYGNGP